MDRNRNDNLSRMGISQNIISKIKYGLTIIWILICFILFFIISIPILLYRWVLWKLCNVLKSYSHILSPQGHFFMSGSNVQTAIWGNVLLKFKIRGVLSFDSVKRLYASRMIYARNENGRLLYPEFQQYCEEWGGFYFWKQEAAFSVDEHTVLYSDISNESKKLSQSDINQIEDEFLRSEFDLDKSPWQVMIIDNNIMEFQGDEESSYLVLFKFHHTLGDGYALFKALMKCCDEPPLELHKLKSSSSLSLCSKFIRCITFPFKFAIEFVKLSQYNNSVQPLELWENISLDLSPFKSKQQVIAWQSPLSSSSSLGRIDVNTLKSIAKQCSVSFTTILFAAIAGGLRNFLLTKSIVLPENIMCALPIPDPEHPDRLINSMCIVFLKLPIGSENTIDRLNQIESNLKEKKKNPMEPLIRHFFISLAGYLPKCILNLLPKSPLTPSCVVIFPGPLKSVRFNGQELYDMNCTSLSTTHCFVVRVLTYANELQIVCNGDYRLFSNEEMIQILNLIETEFLTLQNINFARMDGSSYENKSS